MALLTKLRARKPLANSDLTISGTKEDVRLSVVSIDDETDKQTNYGLTLSIVEAIRVADMVAGLKTHEIFNGGFYNPDRRTTPNKLRALADKLEAEGNMQRMALTD